jgi:hypothetical protein
VVYGMTTRLPAWIWVRKWIYLLKGLFLAVENSSTMMLVYEILTMIELGLMLLFLPLKYGLYFISKVLEVQIFEIPPWKCRI